jgi:hypothetical protein
MIKNNWFQTLLLSFFLFFLGSALAAPDYVVGFITEEESGDPVPWANIYTRSGKVLGQANSRGRFEVEVQSRNAILVFKKFGYEEVEIDLSEESEFIDLEVTMVSKALELRDKRVRSEQRIGRNRYKTQSVAELEQFQGMRIDLNDHLSQMVGVSGIGEYSSDISVYGGRTRDVVQYLGNTKIPNMRHLDFGLPGNQSVINPRLLKSVSVEDDLTRGPVGQGNSSALKYDLKRGDPEYLTGDVVFGTFNRELNATGYWGDRTFLGSFRNLSPTFLGNLGSKFFTIPKETRIGQNCNPAEQVDSTCSDASNPLDISALDLLLATQHLDSNGATSNWTFLMVGDDYNIQEDLSTQFGESQLQVVERGYQWKFFGANDRFVPTDNGSRSYSLGFLYGVNSDENRDTSTFAEHRFFAQDDGANIIAENRNADLMIFSHFQWDPTEVSGKNDFSYGLELEYHDQSRRFLDQNLQSAVLSSRSLDAQMWRGDFLARWNRKLTDKQELSSSLGIHQINGNIPKPLASLRYTVKPQRGWEVYGDLSVRENTDFSNYTYRTESQTTGSNIDTVDVQYLSAIDPKTTTSLEGKLGFSGGWGALNWSNSYYMRHYLEPSLPEPSAYWYYRELQEAQSATVYGTNLNLTWTPIHHFGMNWNGSIVQGDYKLKGNNPGHLAWEANRSLDMVTNIRLLPRRDSLVSVIITYVANNEAPLYEYGLPFDNVTFGNEQRQVDTRTRTVRQSTSTPTVSRQRVDVRINLDLNSKWKPLDQTRFYFQASNVFANVENTTLQALGGENTKQRGWTRLGSGAEGDLSPVTIRGLGFFILFGFEMNLSI